MPQISTRLRILHEAAQGVAFLHCTGAGLKPLLHLDIKRLTFQQSYRIFHNNLTTFKISDGLKNNVVNSAVPIPLMKACMLKSVISDWLRSYLMLLMAETIYVQVESMSGSRGYEAEEYFDGQLGFWSCKK